ncbi:serine hydrolase [Medicago truncatula]|uniref:Serine hydrolase n=1 Tax=Medicago truncatula TaxID=3880 RepID=A0A072U952_MEDTR|nr:serine hydrolase [Medicago truncatula]
MENEEKVRKPKILCLHGFRTSGEIMKKQIHKWPQNVLDKLDLVFVEAPFPCNDKSDVEDIFDPPYYEWFPFNEFWLDLTWFVGQVEENEELGKCVAEEEEDFEKMN